MTFVARLGAAIAAVAAFLAFAPAARADMHVCNQTSYILYTAIGFKSGSGIETRGWTRVAPGDCALAIHEALTQPIYFMYAKSSLAHSGPARVWGGQYRLCTKNTDFAIQTPSGAPSCGSDDVFLMPFASVLTHGHASWTATFTESPQINTFYAAQQAGISRLLSDIGFKGSLGEGKSRDDALAQLRARLKVPANASPDELFVSLEAEAMKASAPAGYSICNDADSVVWAALAMQQGTNTVARGWWKISPGGCAKAITDRLSTDRIFLLAEKHGNDHLVSGPEKLCVTNIEFEIYGGQTCGARGLIEAGFAITNTKGQSGFVAHIGPNGLLQPGRQFSQARTPK